MEPSLDQMSGGNGKEKETVKVVVRCRPLFGKEIVEGRKSIITLDPQACIISIKCPENDQVKSFTFDSVYDETTSQRQFYDESGYPLVESIFEGYNGTIFAYGQTGCGKTHTMQGKDNPPELRGVIPHSFDHIFDTINADPSREYMVRASYLEIYNEDIRDLLSDDSKKKLDLKESVEGTVYVKDLTEVVVQDVESMNRVMNRGFKNRTIGATLMNEGSSRSHSIFTVVVETSEKIGGEEHFKAGKLNLVDLAGSERQSKTGATGNRLKEGCKINLSLSALGNVISALVDGKGKHIPYRDSKLTRLLQDSLGGNTKTLMVAAVSPADYNYDETLSTLRYANRAKNIKNKPIVNEDPKDAKLREYKEEIERLKKLLENQSRGSVIGTSSGMSTPIRQATPRDYTLTVRSIEDGMAGLSAPAERDADSIAKEREEIAKYQQEAAEMLEKANRMMEEARALQAQQQKQLQLHHEENHQMLGQQQRADGDAGTPSTTNEASSRTETPRLSSSTKVGVTSGERRYSAMTSLGDLPPITSPRTKQETPSDRQIISSEVRAQTDNSSSETESISTKVNEDPTNAEAIKEAAAIDAQAKVMMAKAEQMMQEAEKRSKEAQQIKVVKEVVVKEVIPDHHVKEKEELKEMNQTILNQRDQIGKELEKTQMTMEAYMKEKDTLEAKLKKIESHILGGASIRGLKGLGSENGKSNTLIDSEIALLKQQVDYRRAQIKLKEKAKKEAQNEAARKALVIEKQIVEEELKNTQETAQANLVAAKKKESKYRAKLEAARQEIMDLNNEFERERENLLDTIREQTKESKLLEQLVGIFLPQNELVKVWERAVWNEEREDWQLPRLKPRSDFQKIKLPALNLSGNGMTTNNVEPRPPSGQTIESGGAEVASDDESGGGSVVKSGNGSSTVRSSNSSANSKHRKHSTKAPSPSHGAQSKPSSSSDASMFTGRNNEHSLPASINAPVNGYHHNVHKPLPLNRLLSPEMGKLPTTIRTSRYDSTHDTSTESPSHRVSPSSKKSGASPNSNEKRAPNHRENGKGEHSALITNSGSPRYQYLPPSDDDRISAKEEHYFFSDRDMLFPLSGEYQSRDRLQSRQGSRQGSRSSDRNARNSGSVPSSNCQTTLGEFGSPDCAVDKPSGSKGSRSSSRHHHHRDRKEHDYEVAGANDALENWQVPSSNVDSENTDASLIKRKSGKHKKKKERRDKNAPDEDDKHASSRHGFLPHTLSVQSPEDQEMEYY